MQPKVQLGRDVPVSTCHHVGERLLGLLMQPKQVLTSPSAREGSETPLFIQLLHHRLLNGN